MCQSLADSETSDLRELINECLLYYYYDKFGTSVRAVPEIILLG